MAEKPNQAADAAEPAGVEAPAAPAKVAFYARFLTAKWLLIVVGVSVVLHVAGLAYVRVRLHAEPPAAGEIGLGTFHFEGDRNEGGSVCKADFALHISLLEPLDPAAQQRLAARKYHVQQDVEELLRKAHSGDFEDPGLSDLKRQVHEQINQTLGLRAVSEVIITDLKLQHGQEGLEKAEGGGRKGDGARMKDKG
jgi:flagellar basal body-associated protein FliL